MKYYITHILLTYYTTHIFIDKTS